MKKYPLTGRILLAMTAGILALSGVAQAQGKKAMSFTDVVSLKRVSSPALAPDGKQLIFTISTACWKKNKNISHIWKINNPDTQKYCSEFATPLPSLSGSRAAKKGL